MRKIAIMLCLLCASPTWAANFSGKWIIENPGRNGRHVDTAVTLNQIGDSVTGSVSNPGDIGTGSPVNIEIYDGKIEGDNISFYVWRGSEEPTKLFYKGTLAGPDKITFHVNGGPLRGNTGLSGVGPIPPIAQTVTANRTR